MDSRSNTIANHFDKICLVLESLGYLAGDGGYQVSEQGRMLARIYAELDLVAAECIRAGVFADLTHPQLAAVLASLVFEARRADEAHRPRMPDARSNAAMTEVRRIWREISLVERDARLDEIFDALPHPVWPSYFSKLVALMGALAVLLLVAMGTGIAVQLAHGYHRLQLGLYVATLFGTERTEIVDWYHASEHVWTLAKALHGEDAPATQAWATTGLAHLWQGGPKQLLAWFDASQLINKVTLDATDPISLQTDFKKCAVKIVKA